MVPTNETAPVAETNTAPAPAKPKSKGKGKGPVKTKLASGIVRQDN